MSERRQHKRFDMPRGVFAILRPESQRLRNYSQMSIGEIAVALYKSEPEVVGQVKNLSMGGLAFDCQNEGPLLQDGFELDLLITGQGFYLHNIPFCTVSQKGDLSNMRSRSPEMQRRALCFGELGRELKGQLELLLANQDG